MLSLALGLIRGLFLGLFLFLPSSSAAAYRYPVDIDVRREDLWFRRAAPRFRLGRASNVACPFEAMQIAWCHSRRRTSVTRRRGSNSRWNPFAFVTLWSG